MATALSKPEPMNAITSHSKVRTSLKFVDTLFIAGDAVTGKMEMECKTDTGLGIGVIMVELFATEELTSRDHSATQTFMHSRRIFQGPGLPPSNSVHPFPMPDEPPLPMHYYHARRGTTTFLFRFPLPETSPSAISFGSGIAQLRYEVRATVGVVYKGERQLVTDKKTVDVVEMYREDTATPVPEGTIVGENGKILMQGKVLGGVLVAGQPACVELLVKNHSSKKNTGLSVSLRRDLHLAGPSHNERPPLQLSDTLTSVSFRGPEFIIQPGIEGVANLVFDVPMQARGLKGGPRENGEDQRISNHLFEVRSTVIVCLTLGFGSKDLYLELPVTILQPAAVPKILHEPYPPDPRPYSPMHNMPSGSFNLSFPSFSPQPSVSPPLYNYGSPLITTPALSFVHQGRVWLPPVSPDPYAGLYGAVSPEPYPPYSSGYNPQHISPARPSSAEPISSQSFYPPASGLPYPAVQQPLAPVQAGASPVAERVEGKGQRASRVSHHLRMSSRNRSVSPLSHRYAPPTIENESGPSLRPQTPPSHHRGSSQGTTELVSPGLHIGSNSDVASPRPMPSPKQTYSVDPFSLLTFSKSERVETLERIAAQTDDANKDMSSSVPDLTLDRDKTLPVPPVPSHKPAVAVQPATNVADIFAPSVEELLNATPPTPTLAAVTSSKASRIVMGQLGGLDALEARLLAEVGTRKVERSSSRPDVRSIMPINIPRPNTVVEPAIDSAISSLSLPGLGADEGTLRLEVGSYQAEASERGKLRVQESAPAVVPEGHPPQGDSERRVRKQKSDQKVHGDGVKEKEQQRLRKAAQGRVAAWLGSIDPEAPPQTATPSQPNPPPLPADDPLPSGSRGTEPAPIVLPRTPEELPARVEEQPTQAEQSVDAKPNPRSSGFMPIRPREDKLPNGPAKPWLFEAERKGLLSPRSKHPQDPEARYDVRSARGGRGGQVAAVAAIWAAQGSKPSSPTPIAKPVTKPVSPPPKKLADWRRLSRSPPPQQPDSKASRTHATTPISPAADLAARRARLAKSSSVPAVVSSSMATPMLSSTASLARPLPKLSPKPTVLPPTVQEAQGPKSSAAEPKTPKQELAFGQARLRELIKKYQG